MFNVSYQKQSAIFEYFEMQRNVKLNKNLTLWLILLSSFIVSRGFSQNYSHLIPNQYKLRTIVIDAGHGGHDKGAVGTRGQEKQVTLQIAKQLETQLRQQLPGVKVFQTRYSDQFVTLKQRTQLANNKQADLFISIHCNAADKSASGTELYIVGNAANSVATRENNSILIEDGSPTNYATYYNGANSASNRAVANYINNALSNIGRPSRGIKEASFIVLREAQMPSVLIETAFITNSNDQQFLFSHQGQKDFAQAIATGVASYKKELDRKAQQILEQKREEITRLEVQRKRRTAEEAEARHLAELERLRKQESAWAWKSVRSLNLTGEQYLVQLIISKQYDEKDFPFENVVISRIDVIDSYKYLIGPVSSRTEAEKLHKQAQEAGYRNAFILKYKNGKVVR